MKLCYKYKQLIKAYIMVCISYPNFVLECLQYNAYTYYRSFETFPKIKMHVYLYGSGCTCINQPFVPYITTTMIQQNEQHLHNTA